MSHATAFLHQQYKKILQRMNHQEWLEQVEPLFNLLRQIPRAALNESRAAVEQISSYLAPRRRLRHAA